MAERAGGKCVTVICKNRSLELQSLKACIVDTTDSLISKGCFSLSRGLFPMCCLLWLVSPLVCLSQQSTVTSPGRVASLAFFLDSTDTVEQGSMWVGTTFTRRQTPTGEELDIPALTLSYGLLRQIQLDFSIPYFKAQYGPDFQLDGIGDGFLSAKFRVLDADSKPLGLAFEPTLEILGKASLAAGDLGPEKYNWAFPVILQKNFPHLNLYGEAGYITRGAIFAGIGGDGAVLKRLGLSWNILYSRATRYTELSQLFDLQRSRVDGNVGFYYVFNPHFSIFGSAGRTLGSMDAISTQYIVNLGIILNFKLTRFGN